MRVKTEFQIYERTHRSGNKGWQVSVGIVNGKRKLQSCSTLEEAQLLKATLEEREALKNPAALSELDELGKAAIRHALAKLKPFDATITEAVDFFVKYAKPPKGKITIKEATDLWVKQKTKEGMSVTYIEKAERCFFRPFREKMKNCLLSDVSPTAAHRYIFGKKEWNATSRNTHRRHLRTLYSFAKGYAPLNPFDSVPTSKPQRGLTRNKILSVDDTEKLLQYALDEGQKAACASMVLVFFCGVRVEEVERLKWELIDWDAVPPSVAIEEPKKDIRRVNDICENGLCWLLCCKGKGRIAPENYEKVMQRLRKKSGVAYPQNAARHSFASYHMAMHKDGKATAFMLGHPDADLLYRTYNQLVKKAEAERYWQIVPRHIKEQQEAEITQVKNDLESFMEGV